MKISQMSEKLAISVDTLRYYDKIGLLSPQRAGSGNIRNYCEKDVAVAKIIIKLRDTGFSLDEIRRILSIDCIVTNFSGLSDQEMQRIASLKQLIDHKIHENQIKIELLMSVNQTLTMMSKKLAHVEKNRSVPIDDPHCRCL